MILGCVRFRFPPAFPPKVSETLPSATFPVIAFGSTPNRARSGALLFPDLITGTRLESSGSGEAHDLA